MFSHSSRQKILAAKEFLLIFIVFTEEIQKNIHKKFFFIKNFNQVFKFVLFFIRNLKA